MWNIPNKTGVEIYTVHATVHVAGYSDFLAGMPIFQTLLQNR